VAREFGQLQAAVMDLLWSRGTPATVREVRAQLHPERELAYTTVLTVMETLYRQGWLRREPAGRAHRYQPVTSRVEHSVRRMRDALTASGDPSAALRRFVSAMSPSEADALRAALHRHISLGAS
jgi:predicted transcriptional regulator